MPAGAVHSLSAIGTALGFLPATKFLWRRGGFGRIIRTQSAGVLTARGQKTAWHCITKVRLPTGLP